MNIVKGFLLVFALLGLIVAISANSNYTDPNCGWSGQPYRAVGDWAIDAGSSSNWNPAEPLGLMQPTDVISCEYAVDIHGLQTNKSYQWKVVIGYTWDINWGCPGRNGPNCQFNTSTGSIRLQIIASFDYPLTSEVIDNLPTPSLAPTTTSSPSLAPTTTSSPQSNSSKKVFAHYMVGLALLLYNLF